jgi:dTDP-4-dehydrorhamnose reductase
MKKILIVGGSGYIGSHFGITYPRSKIVSTYLKTKVDNGVFFDLSTSKLHDVIAFPNEFSHVLIMAGIVRFNNITDNLTKAYDVNVNSVKKLVDDIVNMGLIPVFISSESVFDGDNGGYTEEDEPNPIFDYGMHKYKVEEYIKKVASSYLIIRLAKVFDSNFDKPTLISGWINDLNHNKNIYCANDHVFSPIHIEDVVRYIEKLIEMGETGIFHVCSQDLKSRLQMLEYLINRYANYAPYVGTVIEQPLHSFKGAENIPLNTSMNPKKIIKTVGIYPRNFSWWADTLIGEFFSREME